MNNIDQLAPKAPFILNYGARKPAPISTMKTTDLIKKYNAISLLLIGENGVGKTSTIKTLDPATALFVDVEGHSKPARDWGGDIWTDLSYEQIQDIACLIGGPTTTQGNYSKSHYEWLLQVYGGHNPIEKYKTIFIDSLTCISNMCFEYCTSSEEVTSKPTQKTWTTDHLLREQMDKLLKQITSAKNKGLNIIMTAGLDTDPLVIRTCNKALSGRIKDMFDDVIRLKLVSSGEKDKTLIRQFQGEPDEEKSPVKTGSGITKETSFKKVLQIITNSGKQNVQQ